MSVLEFLVLHKASGNQRRCGYRPCKVCSGHHVWRCDRFKAMSLPERWEATKSVKLCYRCLVGDHSGKKCVRREVEQGASGCSQAVAESETINEMALTLSQDPVEQATQRYHTTLTSQSAQLRFVAARTIPVFLKNGNCRIEVNALLDEASTKSYLNADVAAELGLQGHPQSVNVNVLT